MKLNEKYPIRYKFWCVIKEVILRLSIRLDIMYDNINRIHHWYSRKESEEK